MALLALDIGNTARKWAVVAGGVVSAHGHWHTVADLPAQGWARVGYVASGAVDAATATWLQAQAATHLTGQTPGLLHNRYETPHTLGADRWAAANGAWAQRRAGCTAVVVFSLGTACTCEVVQAGHYLGGSISPGVQLRLQALHAHTAALPLVAPGPCRFPAPTTHEALLAGALKGMALELNGRVAQVTALLGSPPDVFVCGGEAPYFESYWKTPIFARPHLVLEGIWHLMQTLPA